MKKPAGFDYLLLIIKAIVFVAACYFLFQVMSDNMAAIKTYEIKNLWLLIFAASISIVIYIILMMLLVLGWQRFLTSHSSQAIAYIYFKSQILKYLPGNIFHFAYRHTKTASLGFSHKELIQASLSETLGLVIAALLTSHLVLLWPEGVDWISHWLPVPIWLFILIEIIVVVILIYVLHLARVYAAYFCYLLYFFGMGLIAYGLIDSLGFEPQGYFLITAYFSISWLAGYLIPGAPGGTGVREAVFIMISAPQFPAGQALILVAIIRLVSIIAETVIYLIAKPLSQPYHHLAVSSDKTRP